MNTSSRRTFMAGGVGMAAAGAVAGRERFDGRGPAPSALGLPGLRENDLRFATWYQAVKSVATARANVLVVGDSISEGRGSDRYADGYIHVLRKTLQRALRGAEGGEGFIPTTRGWDNNAQPGNGDPWNLTNATIDRSTANINGLGRRAVVLGSGAVASRTFRGTRVQLMFTGSPTTGTARIVIDGGAAQTFSTTVPTTRSGLSYLSGVLPLGEHTVTVERVTSASVILDGGCFFSADDQVGVTMWDASHSGWATHHFDGHDGASARWATALPDVDPHLAIIALGTNDENQVESPTYSPEIYADRLLAIATTIAANSTTDPSIAFLLQPVPGANNGLDWWGRHRAAAIDVANANGIALIDLHGEMPPGPMAGGSSPLYADGNHPNSLGHQRYSELIADALQIGDQPADGYAFASRFGSLAVGDQIVPHATVTPVLFDTAVTPEIGMTYNASSGELTVSRPGRYRVETSLGWSPHTVGLRSLFIIVNGVTRLRGHVSPDRTVAGQTFLQVSKTVALNAGDTIRISCYQNSGQSLTLVGDNNRMVALDVVEVPSRR